MKILTLIYDSPSLNMVQPFANKNFDPILPISIRNLVIYAVKGIKEEGIYRKR